MGMDTAFIAMLFLTSLTGMALLILRETAAMGAPTGKKPPLVAAFGVR